MDKIIVGYWSMTGNTKAMAMAIGQGITEAGKTSEVKDISKISIEDIKNTRVLALGCPAMGVETLEESEMEPFIDKIEQIIAGKNIALFGSFGWGDGQWMKDWEERMTSAGAILLNDHGFICQETPEKEELEKCRKIGEQISLL